MWPNLQLAADLVTFTEEILNGKLHFLWRVWCISAAPLITPNRQNFGFKAVNYISRVFEWLGKTFVALGNITLIVIYSPIVLYFQFVLVALIKFAIIGNSSHCISQRVWKSSHRRCSVKQVLMKLSKFTGKYLCRSLFFNQVACLMLWTFSFIKK